MIEIRINGAGQAQRGLQRVRRRLLLDVDRAIGRAVSPPQLRRHVPIDTGALRASVRARRITLGHWRLVAGNRKAYYPHLVDLKGVRRTRRQWDGLMLMRLRREMRRLRRVRA